MNNRYRTKVATMLSAAMLLSVSPAAVFAESANKAEGSSTASAAAISVEGEGVTGQMDAPVDVKVTKEKAESLARQYVSIPDDYKLQGASFSTDIMAGGQRSAWGLDFIKKVNGKHLGSIYVSIHADSGQLLDFQSYVDNVTAKPTYPLKVERETAKEIALKFIANVAGSYNADIVYNEDYGVQLLPPLSGEFVHTIRFDRQVHGIPYVDNYIQLQVDSEGHIRAYSLRWDDSVIFPKVDTKLTLEEANAKLRESASPELSYILPYSSSSQGRAKPILSYSLKPIAIDAATGELKKQDVDHYRGGGSVSASPVSDKPLGEAPKAGKVTEKQAAAAVKAAFKLPDNAELTGSNYNEYQNENTGETEMYWHLNWQMKKDGKESGSASATVDGRTGMVRSFYNYNFNAQSESDSKKITLEQAASHAAEAVKKHLPWLAHELYIVNPDPKQYEQTESNDYRQYYFSFVHKIHGAAAEYDHISVAIDARTGEVVNYETYIANFAYPDKAPTIISKDEAVDNWLQYYRTQLTYRLVQQFSWNGQPIPIEKYKVMLAAGEISSKDVSAVSEAELVYTLVPRLIEEDVVLDAETGSWRNRDTGEPAQLERAKVTDIEGHWAEHQLELMVAYKALDVKDGQVRPNELVTRGELIKMLVLARNSGRMPIRYGAADSALTNASFKDVAASSAYFVYVESALEQNLIDLGDGSFNPEGKVSRDEMAELIVRALGYNALAEYEHIFKDSFKDSAQIGNKGQAAIVVGLKIMNLTDGKFLPKKQVTRAEASVAFFRYLQTRAELQEAPIRM